MLILIYKQQTAQNIIEIGKRLIKVKENLPHGEWGKWLEDKVDFSRMQANRFIRVANEFSKDANVTTLLQSGSSKVFALLDLPQEEIASAMMMVAKSSCVGRFECDIDTRLAITFIYSDF